LSSNGVEQQQKINGFFSVPGDATQKRTRRLVSDAMFDEVGLKTGLERDYLVVRELYSTSLPSRTPHDTFGGASAVEKSHDAVFLLQYNIIHHQMTLAPVVK